MSNPKDTIACTFTRDELHLIRTVFTRDDSCCRVEQEAAGKLAHRPDRIVEANSPLCERIVKELRFALEDESEQEQSMTPREARDPRKVQP
jgi:hypothetical protein